MSRIITRWSEEEDQVIINYLKEDHNYKNLAESFRYLAETNELLLSNNRTAAAIGYRYSTKIKNTADIFMLSSKNGAVKNRKYIPENTQVDFLPVESIMSQLLELPRRERQRILNFFSEML